MKTLHLPVLLLTSLLALAACTRKTSAPAVTYAAPQTAVTDSSGRVLIPGEGINREREQLIGRINAQVEGLNRQMDDLEKQQRDLSRQGRDLKRKRKKLEREAKKLGKYDATAEWQNRKERVNELLKQ